MKLYRIDYHLHSATASAWHADTVFGHLCWAMRYTESEASLAQMLDACRQGHPPILVSNGFPAGLFPNLITPPLPLDSAATLQEQRSQAQQEKEARQVAHLTLEEFNRAINGEMFLPSTKKDPTHQVTLKNQISRLTGTTGGEGNLYDFEETFYPAISIYAKIEDNFVQRARQLFLFIAEDGYGKRKSVGYGAISSMTFAPLEGLRPPQDTNGFVTLSNFVPAKGDPTAGSWGTIVKYGKLGEEYAIGGSPFKLPVVMLVAGSAFYDNPLRPFYGRMVPGISPAYPRVIQYGFALAIPARLRFGEESIGTGTGRKRRSAS